MNIYDQNWIQKFFKEVEFLLKSYNSCKDRDCTIVISWIEKGHSYFNAPDFNHITMARFLDDLAHIIDNHPKIKECILQYVNTNDHFREELLNKSYELLLLARPIELCHILRGISFLEISHISEEWWSRWFSTSLGVMNNFTNLDTRQSIRSCSRLHKTPPREWYNAWSTKCEEHLSQFPIDLDSFGKTLSAIGLSKLNIDKNFLHQLINNTRVYLSALSDKDLFLVSRSFSLEDVCLEKRLVSDWFKISYDKIPTLKYDELEALCIAFSFIAKLDENVSHLWIERCIEKITLEFNSLSIKAISLSLYPMSLFQLNPIDVLPFLEKCKLLFRKEKSKIFNESIRISDFKRIIQASFYFKLKGFDLGLSLKDFPLLLEKTKQKEISNPSDGEQLVLNNLSELSIHHVAHEHWIDEIMDYVDFSVYVGNSQKIVEFDGRHHEVNSMTNRLTQLKTFILNEYGYELIRINYKDKQNIKTILIQGFSLTRKEEITIKNDNSKFKFEKSSN